MKKLVLPLALLVTLAGCQANDQVRRVETPVNVTHEVAFSDYRRVFNTAYHIVNRYGVVQKSSYRYGEITALVFSGSGFYATDTLGPILLSVTGGGVFSAIGTLDHVSKGLASGPVVTVPMLGPWALALLTFFLGLATRLGRPSRA